MIRLRRASFWLRYLMLWLIAPALMALDQPIIDLSINIDTDTEIRVNRNLVKWQTATFRVTYTDADGAVDLTSASAKLTVKTVANVEAGSTNTVFEVDGAITDAANGIASFTMTNDLLTATGRLRFEFMVHNAATEIRPYADIYVVPGTYIGGAGAWTPPSPSTNYYTKAEVDALVADVAFENANNTFIAGATNTFNGVLRSEYIYPTDDYDSYIRIWDNSSADTITIGSATTDAITLNADGGSITLDGAVYIADDNGLGIGSTAANGLWSSEGLLWIKGAAASLIVSERTDAADYIYAYTASDIYQTVANDVSQVRYFGDSSNPVNTVDWFTSDPGTGDDPIMRIYMIAGGAGNALQFGRATAIDAVTITSLGEQILFGDTASPTMGLVNDPGEVGFLEDVEVDGIIQLDGAVYVNGTVSDPDDTEILVTDNLTLSNATTTVSLKANAGTYPELSFNVGSDEVLELQADGADTFDITDKSGYNIITFQYTSDEMLTLQGGNSPQGIIDIGEGTSSGKNIEITGDTDFNDDLTIQGDVTIDGSAKTLTLGADEKMKLRGYGMFINADETAGAPYFIDTGTNASDGDGVVTQAFTVTFASAPIVTVTYAENQVVSTPVKVYSITTTNCVFAGDADVTVNWIAIGPK